jgi:uncharacterized protein (TIGR03437 family)
MHGPTLLLHFIAIASICTSYAGDFRLGIGSTVTLPDGALPPLSAYIRSVQVDAKGSRYVLATGDPSRLAPTTVLAVVPGVQFMPYVVKLSPTGDRIVYLTILDFGATAIAVDSSGAVFLAGAAFTGDPVKAQNEIVKLKSDGTGVEYRFFLGNNTIPEAIATDAAGRVYVAGQSGSLQTTSNAFQKQPANGMSGGFVLRLNAAGSGIEWATYVSGSGNTPEHMVAISVDDQGAPTIAGITYSPDFPTTQGAWRPAADAIVPGPFLTRLSPDGSTLAYSTMVGSRGSDVLRMAVDRNGSATVLLRNPWVVRRFDANGKSVVFSRPVPSAPSDMKVGQSGEIYVAGDTTAANLPVRNSLTDCTNGSSFLEVLSPAGELLQGTYLPNAVGRIRFQAGLMALGPDDTVQLLSTDTAGDVLSTASLVLRQDSTANVVRFACIGNAASYDAGAVAPGEIVSLFGNGLGPANAVSLAPGADRYPTDAGVQVLFDGIPAPLLYLSETQVNAIAPWGLTVGKSTQICVVNGGTRTNCLDKRVVAAAPGVFTDGCGYASALNQDGTVNSAANAAEPGSIGAVLGTGLGPMDPQPADGTIVRLPLPKNLFTTDAFRLMPTIQYSPVPVAVTYYGPAPFQAAGVSQVKLQVTGEAMFIRVWTQDATLNGNYFRIHVKGESVVDSCAQ